MKKLVVAIVVLVSMFQVSCEKDAYEDYKIKEFNEKLKGTWVSKNISWISSTGVAGARYRKEFVIENNSKGIWFTPSLNNDLVPFYDKIAVSFYLSNENFLLSREDNANSKAYLNHGEIIKLTQDSLVIKPRSMSSVYTFYRPEFLVAKGFVDIENK